MAGISESKAAESQVDDGLGIDYADDGYVIAEDANALMGDEIQSSSAANEID